MAQPGLVKSTMGATCLVVIRIGFFFSGLRVLHTRMVALTYCRPQDVAAIIFSEKVAYDGCKICDDPKSELYKTYIRKDEDCATAKINLLTYKTTKSTPCPPGGDDINHCKFDDKALYGTDNTSDCPDENYQARKSVYSRVLRACTKILETTKATPNPTSLCPKDPVGFLKCVAKDDKPIPMTSLCPVPISSFLKCDPTTRKCRYTSDSNEKDKVAACTNAFDGCQDSEYLADKAVWEKLNANCAAKWEHQNSLNLWMPLCSGVFILLILLGMMYTGVNAGATAERPPQNNGVVAGGGGEPGWLCTLRGGKFLLITAAFLAFGLGFLGYALGWWLQSDDSGVPKESKDGVYFYLGIGLTAVGGLFFAVWCYALAVGSCEQVVRLINETAIATAVKV